MPTIEQTPIALAAKNALDVQDACNLSGVVHAWHRSMDAVWTSVRAGYGGTDAVNRHATSKLFAYKLFALAFGFEPEGPAVMDAYREALVEATYLMDKGEAAHA